MNYSSIESFEQQLSERLDDVRVYKCQLKNLRSLMKWLKEETGYIYLTDLFAVDQREKRGCFSLRYLLLNLEEHRRLQVEIDIHEDEIHSLENLSDIWPHVSWTHKELWDLFGLKAESDSEERLYNPSEFSGFPLRKDFQARELSIDEWPHLEKRKANHSSENTHVFGPQKIGTSLLEFDYTTRDDRLYVDPVRVGLAHVGLEKIFESQRYEAITDLIQRCNSSSGEIYRLAWARTFEKLCGFKVPQRAQALRMVYAEFARIQDHLTCLSYATREAALCDVFELLQLQKENLYTMMQNLSGKRLNSQLIVLGGVSFDLPLGWMGEALSVLRSLQHGVIEIKKRLIRSRQWMEKTKVSKVRPFEALEWGYTGPALRACGVNFDLRKRAPFYFYEDVDFEVPLGINGDSYDRFLVRIEEIFQSIGILGQLLDHLPGGSFIDREQLDVLRDSKKHLQPREGEVYQALEAANGELGIALISDSTHHPFRLRLRTPSFFLAQSLNKVLVDQYMDQAMMSIHSFNIIQAEVDR